MLWQMIVSQMKISENSNYKWDIIVLSHSVLAERITKNNKRILGYAVRVPVWWSIATIC